MARASFLLTPEREREIRDWLEAYGLIRPDFYTENGARVRDLLAALDEHRRVGDALADVAEERCRIAIAGGARYRATVALIDRIVEWRKLRGQHEGEA